MNKFIFFLLTEAFCLLILLSGCGTANHLKNNYTYEDKTVFELIDRLKKNPADQEAFRQLPDSYKVAADKRKALTEGYKSTGSPGDRWMLVLRECEIMQQIYDAVKTNPSASRAIPNPWDPALAIMKVKQLAAKEYYELGLVQMNYDNRQSAASAYQYFSQVNNLIPGYENTQNLMQQARDRATLKVIVQPVRYYTFNWSYFGFQNDWLQQQMVYDLNNRSFNNVQFFTDRDASSRHLRADRVVDLNFTGLSLGTVYTDRYTINRSVQVQTGTTKSIPSKPVYTTVRATVNVTRRYMRSNAVLECRIYERPSGSNILYDRFPDNYEWRAETATYQGDSRALQQEDWQRINNNQYQRPPSRNEVADRLIRNCYALLLNRINTGVQF